MARIAFVQQNTYEQLGLMYVSSLLKNNEHKVELFLKNGKDERLAKEVISYNPDVVAFSCTTGTHKWCLRIAGLIKNHKATILTLLGGPHPTFFPEVIEEFSLDIICQSEGEYPMLELADAITQNKDFSKIQNLWVKKNGEVIKNNLRPLIKDLDTLPFMDRELYYSKYPYLDLSLKSFITTRGCPYKCSFCYNEILQKMYPAKDKYVRRRTVDNVIAEIKETRDRYKLRTIYIQDDVFILDKSWVGKFAEKYKKEVGLPSLCLIRADLIDEDVIKKLKLMSCHNVCFGIESGNEKFRNMTLSKKVSDEAIFETAKLLKKYKITFRTCNMFGLPGETLENAFETVAINIKIGTDYPWCSLYQSYPRLKLTEYASKNNLIRGEARISYFRDSPLKSIYKNEFVNLHKLFFYAVKFPILLSIIKQLIKLRPNLIFDLLFLISYGYIYLKGTKILLREMITVGMKNLEAFYSETRV